MPKLKSVHGAIDEGNGIYLADIDLLWEDGNIERCPYGVSPDDQAPICVQIREMIARGAVKISQPPEPKKISAAVTGGPDVIA